VKTYLALAVVVSVGLVAGCQLTGADSPPSSEPSVSTPGPESADDDTLAWIEEYIAAADQVTTVHITVHQEILTGGEAASTHLEVDVDGADRYCEGEALGYTNTIIILDGTAYLLDEGQWEQTPRGQLSVTETQLNPAASIALQRVAITRVDLVGSEDVDGVLADHYLITFDAAQRTDLPLGVAYEAVFMGDTVTADVWLDPQMRPLKYLSTIMVRQDHASGRVVQEVLYTAYDQPVTIQAPL